MMIELYSVYFFLRNFLMTLVLTSLIAAPCRALLINKRVGVVTTTVGSMRRYHTALRETADADAISSTGASMPTEFNSGFLTVMRDRGFIHQCTDFAGLDELLTGVGDGSKVVKAYLGFDATAKSLHVGSLLQIMILRTLQKQGHKPIVLVGGGTTKVGDPTGKDESRKLLTEDDINDNISSLTQVFEKFLQFGDGPTDAVMVNNADWLDDIKYLDFLRDYGRFFTINRMLSFESVKQRLSREQPFSFLEFNYMLLQSYDFVELNRRMGAQLQLGGSDQWGNIVAGVELGRRVDQSHLIGLTAPLITTSDGKKMGKTASGAVWLNKDLLSEFDYWQFWRNTADADVIRFMKLFTEVPLEKIREYEQLEGAALNDVKVVLADECTRMLHGEECLTEIHTTISSLFKKGGGGDLDSLAKVQLQEDDFHSSEDSEAVVISVVDLLVKAEFAASKGEAKRMIKQGGAKVNDEKVSDEYAEVSKDQFDEEGRLKLSSGKKKHKLVVLP